MAGWLTPGMSVLAPASITGSELNEMDTQLASGQNPQSAAITSTTMGLGVQTVAAAGATQGGATAISPAGAMVFVTVTASTEGVKLPAVSTGALYRLAPSATVGVKVYANAAGQKIGTATTATTAYAVAKGTLALFVGLNTTTWVALKSA